MHLLRAPAASRLDGTPKRAVHRRVRDAGTPKRAVTGSSEMSGRSSGRSLLAELDPGSSLPPDCSEDLGIDVIFLSESTCGFFYAARASGLLCRPGSSARRSSTTKIGQRGIR
jgi:hypothetical protein